MKYIIALLMLSISAFSIEPNKRENNLTGTVLLYIPGMGNTDEEFSSRQSALIDSRRALPEQVLVYKEIMNSIDVNLQVDGVHTGVILPGVDLDDLIVSAHLYLNQISEKSLQALYIETFAGIIVDKKFPFGKLPFDNQINNFLYDTFLVSLGYLEPAYSDLELILNKTQTYLDAKKRIIVVAYSQGGLFENMAYQGLNSTDKYKEKLSCQYGSFHVGSGAPRIFNEKSRYVVVENDILSRRYLAEYRPHLTPNYAVLNPSEEVIRANYHLFLEVYWNFKVEATGNKIGPLPFISMYEIKDLADDMDKDCSEKCKDFNGEEFMAKKHTNPDKTPGGLVSLEAKVSETAFIGNKATVCGRAKVLGSAQILNEAFVGGMAVVKDRAKVKDWARVYNLAIISGDAEISNLAQVYDEAKVTGKAKVGGEAHVKVRAIAAENSQITGKAILTENAMVYGEALIGATIRGEASVGGKVKASENVVIGGKSIVLGNVVLFDNAVIGDKGIVKDNAKMLGKSFVYGNAILAGGAIIKDDSTVVDNAVVLENGKIQGKGAAFGDSFIAGNAIMTENSFLFERAFIEDDVLMAGWSMAFGDSYILEYSRISGNAFINSNFSMFENAHLSGNAYGTDRASAFGSALVYGDAHIIGNAQIFGLAQLFDFALMSGNSRAGGFAKVHGHATITGTAFVDVSGDVCGNTFLNEGYYPFPICNL